MAKELIVQLNEGVEYSCNGELDTAYEVVFTAPDYKCQAHSLKIRGAFIAGLMAMQNERGEIDTGPEHSEDNLEQIPAFMVEMMLADKLPEVLQAFEKIALNVGKIRGNDGDVKLQKSHYQDRMSEEDRLKCAYEYIGFFIAKSILSQMQTPSGKSS